MQFDVLEQLQCLIEATTSNAHLLIWASLKQQVLNALACLCHLVPSTRCQAEIN